MGGTGEVEVEVLRGEGLGEGVDGAFGPEAVAALNRSVAAYRDEYGPKVASITREQAAAIVALARDDGLPMPGVATGMRGRLDFEIPQGLEIALGRDLYMRALAMLDLHDPDFRPRGGPRPLPGVAGVGLLHHPDTDEVEVVVGDRSERFRPLHVPRFGLDVSDLVRALGIARDLGAGSGGPGGPGGSGGP